MKIFYSVAVFVSVVASSGCAEGPKYTLGQAEYSAWKGDAMYIRKKSVLINTETGETWGLAYDKKNSTYDGYAWEKISKE